MAKKINFREPKSVMVFNNSRILVAVVRSLHTAARLTQGNVQSISFCCNGKYISTGGYYFRFIHPQVEIEISDLNTLNLEEYDRMCGEERRYHPAKSMISRKKINNVNKKLAHDR